MPPKIRPEVLLLKAFEKRTHHRFRTINSPPLGLAEKLRLKSICQDRSRRQMHCDKDRECVCPVPTNVCKGKERLSSELGRL